MTPDTPLPPESIQVRRLVVEAVERAAELIAAPATAERWNHPSALEGMTVGALAAHLVRAAGATIAYLDRTPSEQSPADELLTPSTYFHAAIASPIHDQIKTVSSDEASIGHQATAEKCSRLAHELSDRLSTEPADRLIAALGGRFLTLDDFCRTRMIEVLLHLDDLAVSTDQPRPETDPEGPALVIDICINIARNLHGDWPVLYALARNERATSDRSSRVFPVF